MPRIYVESDRPGAPTVRVEIITVSEIDGIYTIACSGDQVDACPPDLEPGDTWCTLEGVMQDACVHIYNHDRRHEP